MNPAAHPQSHFQVHRETSKYQRGEVQEEHIKLLVLHSGLTLDKNITLP